MEQESAAAGRPDRVVTRRQRVRLEARLLQARERALQNVSRFVESARTSGPDATGDLSRFPIHAADEGSDAMEQEVAFAIATGTGELYSQIEDALRLFYEEPDRYGLCRNCARAIPFERLELIPWTQLCETCESASEAASTVRGRAAPPREAEQLTLQGGRH